MSSIHANQRHSPGDSDPKDIDVIIVGLGPTGATLAALLGQRGIRVAAFDKLPDLYPLPRAIGLDHEVMRIMQELGIADAVQAHTARYRPSEYRGVDGRLIKRLDMAPPPFRLGWEPNYVFDQPAFEKIISQRLSELESVHVELEADVVGQGQDGDSAWVDVRLRGQPTVTRCTGRHLIACDGGASSIRGRLGITLEDLEFHEHWLVVDALINESKLAKLPQTQVQYCEPSRPSTFVVLPGNHRRWEIMLLPGDSVSPEFPHDELWPLLSRWIEPGDGKLWRAAAYRFHGLVAREWRRERILLAGDAAHMTPPFMAQGMAQGLRDAQNLAWKLDRVLAGTSPHSLLDTYVEERRPHVVTTTRTAIELGRVICERDPLLARERDARLLAEQGGEVRTVFRQNMIPSLTSGLIELDSPGAGSLFPQPDVVSSNFAGRLDDLAGRGIRVAVVGSLDADVECQFLQLLAAHDGRLICFGSDVSRNEATIQVEESRAVMQAWLQSLGHSMAIVRPDNYVYGTAPSAAAGLAMLKRFLQAISIS